jgi:hypothetical protein
MAVREFDGVDDVIITASGGLGQIVNGAFTWVLLVKPTTLAGPEAMAMSAGPGASDVIDGVYDNGAGVIARAGTFGGDKFFGVGMTASAWQVIGYAHPAGTTTCRGHRKVLGSGSWTHVDTSSGTLANISESVDNWRFGQFPDGTGEKDMRLAVVAFWKGTALTDTDYVNIESNATTAFVQSLSPSALWEFNQASTGTAVDDLIGTADQSSITGTTVIGGDDPAWTFATTAAAPGPQRTFNAIPLMH